MTMTTNDNTTLSITWTFELSSPLTAEEKDTIIGNLWEHIHHEREEGIAGFVKIVEVGSPDGKYRVTPEDVLAKITSELSSI